MSCVVLPGVSEASWTAENRKALDHFIVDTTVTALLVYLDGDGRLQVDSSAPQVVQNTSNNLIVLVSLSRTSLFQRWNCLQVLEQLFYFIRHPGAVITEKSFNRVVQFGSVRGEPVRRFLHQLTWLHAPAVALSTSWDKSKQAQHHHHMNDFLSFLSGAFRLGALETLFPQLEMLRQVLLSLLFV